MKKETYKTNHPEIKEITIGDQFVLEGGDIVEFYDTIKDSRNFKFKFKIIKWKNIPLCLIGINYDKNLMRYGHEFKITKKKPTLKDKIKML